LDFRGPISEESEERAREGKERPVGKWEKGGKRGGEAGEVKTLWICSPGKIPIYATNLKSLHRV